MHDDERVAEELEALQAILLNEIDIKTNESGMATGIEMEVHPWTALDVDLQYVRVTLVVHLPKGYPDVRPTVQLKNPRGLEDSLINDIYSQIEDKCNQLIGQPALFELIEVVKEKLTASNKPCVPCCICLYGFRQGDDFIKTDCYHYFHSRCLAGHLTASENIFKEEQDKLPPWEKTEEQFKALCPICRSQISYDVEVLKNAHPPIELEEAPRTFQPTPELRMLQEKMGELFLHQRSKGGIIQEDSPSF